EWNDKFLPNYLIEARPNRKIPGQLSFDSHRLPAQTVLLVSYSKRPDLRTWMQFFGALYVGAGVTVVCRSQESYALWSKLVKLLQANGLSKQNVDAYYVSESRLQQALHQCSWPVVIADGTLAQVAWCARESAQETHGHLVQ